MEVTGNHYREMLREELQNRNAETHAILSVPSQNAWESM